MNFETVATSYLNELQTGSNPCRPKTLAAYGSILRKHLLPRYGQMELATMAQQKNKLLRGMVKDLRADYAPASAGMPLGYPVVLACMPDRATPPLRA